MLEFNLLTEEVIKYKRDDSTVEAAASLSQVYAALMADAITAFPALRPHQRHSWHAFLVQLGAIAMHKAGLTEPPTNADEWQHIIRALTEDEFPTMNRGVWSLMTSPSPRSCSRLRRLKIISPITRTAWSRRMN